jgi:selenocysteine lyase/cysteine desulfurase
MIGTETRARQLFSPAPGTIYLDAATYGLPPQPTVDALTEALARWQSGEAHWVDEWDREGDVSRVLFAELLGAHPSTIALVPTVSAGVGVIAASIPAGSRVVVPDDEFTSVLFPLLVAAERNDVVLKRVPFDDLAAAIEPGDTMVAFSLIRSQDGRAADLAGICQQASEFGVDVLVDSTHATPFVSMKPYLDSIAYAICHGYKHLLCPRGVGFMYVREDRWNTVAPWLSNWRSATPLFGRSYGGHLTLPSDASRFDVSLAWHAWVGARQSLELLVEWQRDGTLGAPLTLAKQLATGLDLPEPVGTLVCMTAPNAEHAETTLAEAGIRCAARGGNLRFSPHVVNTEEEIGRTIEVVRSLREAIS